MDDRILSREVQEKVTGGAGTSNGPVRIDTSDCIGCGHCADTCPTEAIQIIGGRAVVDGNACVECYSCVSTCYTGAISIPA